MDRSFSMRITILPHYAAYQGISSILVSDMMRLVQKASPQTLTSLFITYLDSRPTEQQGIWVAVSQALAQLIHDDDSGRQSASKQFLALLAQNDQLPTTLIAPSALADPVLFLLDNVLQENGNAGADVELLHLLLSRSRKPPLSYSLGSSLTSAIQESLSTEQPLMLSMLK